ncbi:MAG: chemotaxis response regulator protein-glutamate methylesterase [Candidatus Competibacteraceae bacterium]|nr:chemotaxis response regulator protein-glutamate methylesterase [Candidatus Competibacteraceae bacterium]MBK7985204.1 chemotaxis response regulator protein-glutamate methylesterase [Candidatus Competibacteraceae bacterium]MBK8895721.1 chemotaxis response regulator protein-glutamate methylesterase [Candidatus Competibacteraceae bacterium]MBK8962813.1 chemotaxis response regulator protein-glutamate methylesterase [Candidatus Competibacteraceae bacterium]MBK9953254.1 chemotaxis response regulato
MFNKIRLMLVDDSALIRRLLADVLSGDPMLEVAGHAQNGRVALEKLAAINPDLVILDVEMPEMDGLQTLAEIRKRQPRLPVIMFSSITERGAIVTLEALALGANDYVTKPSNTGNMATALQRVRDELIPRIKTFCRHLAAPAPAAQPTPVTRAPAERPPFGQPSPGQSLFGQSLFGQSPFGQSPPFKPDSRASSLPAPPRPRQRVDVVAIGVSTGGPPALAALLPHFPATFPVPIVIVQHMPPIFTRLLAERLANQSALNIAEGAAGELLLPGQVRVAPGGSHMLLERQGGQIRLQLNQNEPENSCRPAVDVLFRSVAEVYRGNTLAVVLTGMGNDGLKGCEAIHKAGGQILVQDEASSVVWSMPGFVAKAGLAESQIPLSQLAVEIIRRIRTGR